MSLQGQQTALALVAKFSGKSSTDPPSPTRALIDHLAKLTATKLAGGGGPSQPKQKKKQQDQGYSSSSSDDDEDYPPDPKQCAVSGPGFAGCASGAPVKLFVHVKDERGRRLKEGGEDVSVRVQASGPVPTYIPVEVTDNNDGSYTAIYTPPAKGNYLVTVELNGISIAGSPFPVFFSSPVDPAEAAALEAAAAQEQQAATAAAVALPGPPPTTASAAALAGMSAVQAITDEHLKTLYVGNISPDIPIERLRELFAILGPIVELTLLGDKKDLGIVVFANKEAQVQGQQLNGIQFGDRPLSVTAPMTAMAAGVVPANPALATQMQQMQQMQQALAQQQKLAMQVAQMRAYAKTGQVHREDPSKAAAEAAARLAQKFGLSSGGTGVGAAVAAASASASAAATAGAARNPGYEDRGQGRHMHGGGKGGGGYQAGGGRDRGRRSRSRSRSRSPRRRSRSRDRRDDRDRHRSRERGERGERGERDHGRDRRDHDRRHDDRDSRRNDKDRGRDKGRDRGDKDKDRGGRRDRGSRSRSRSRDRKRR